MEVRYISVHHTGGLDSNPTSPTSGLSLATIDNAHKLRWPDFRSQLGYWVGYTLLIFPDGSIIQTRLIGEEGAHTKGHNLDSVGVCLLGNFQKHSEAPTPQQKIKAKAIFEALIDGKPERAGLKVLAGTTFAITRERVLPHRKLQQGTICYGDSLLDTWAQELMSQVLYPNEQQEKINLLITLIELYKKMVELLKQRSLGRTLKDCGRLDVRG